MLTKYTPKNREQLEMITLDQLVPENHLVRKVEATIDFSFIYSLVEDAYSAERDRPSIDPVVLIKITFIQYMFGIRSMRKKRLKRLKPTWRIAGFWDLVFMIRFLTFLHSVKTTSIVLRTPIYLNRFSVKF